MCNSIAMSALVVVVVMTEVTVAVMEVVPATAAALMV